MGRAGTLPSPARDVVKQVDILPYLGDALEASARTIGEVSRRLGAAGRDFRQLRRIWSHGGLSTLRKVQLYSACIVPRLLYGLDTAWLAKADENRLDAFHARCLRVCLGIAPSFVSRVPNEAVLQAAAACPLSAHLRCRQLPFLGKCARQHGHSVVHRMTFEPRSLRPRKWGLPRRFGRPRDSWTSRVWCEGRRLCGGSEEALLATLADAVVWQRKCHQLVNHRRPDQ